MFHSELLKLSKISGRGNREDVLFGPPPVIDGEAPTSAGLMDQ